MRVVPQWCRPATRRIHTHLAGTWLLFGVSDPGRIAGASGTEFLRSSDHGHYVSWSPGSGKTHLLSALGQELIRAGRRVVFTTCARLVQDLLLAKKELRLSRAIRKLGYYEGLVIDDLG